MWLAKIIIFLLVSGIPDSKPQGFIVRSNLESFQACTAAISDEMNRVVPSMKESGIFLLSSCVLIGAPDAPKDDPEDDIPSDGKTWDWNGNSLDM